MKIVNFAVIGAGHGVFPSPISSRPQDAFFGRKSK